MRLTLRQRLLALTAAALLPALAAVAYNEYALRRSREAEVHEQALRYGRQAGSELEQIILGMRAVLTTVSAVPAVANAELEPCRAYLRTVRESVPGLSNIKILNPEGRIVCDSEGTPPGLDLSDRPYVAETLASNRFVVGTYQKSRITGLPVLPLAMPIHNAGRRIKAIVATGLRLDWLGERLRERGLSPGGALTIADRNGTIISRDPMPERFVGTRIPDAFQHLVTADMPGTMEVTSQDGTSRIIGYFPVTRMPFGLYVSAGVSRDDAFAPFNRASLVAGLMTALGTAAAFVLAWIFGGVMIRRPVESLIGAVRAWRNGDTTVRTGLKASDGDLEAVGAALDDLMDELDGREAARRRAEDERELLAREMSHRVKNTLAIVQALASQTFARPDVPRERRLAFQQRLVALAGAYDALLARNRVSAELRSVIEAAIRPYNEAGRFALRGPDLVLTPEAVLAFTLSIHELCTNAIKYGALSATNGRVDVTWNIHEGPPERLSLTWTEQGGPPVVSPADKGFGTRLLNGAFANALDPRVDLRFDPGGAVCVIDLLLGPLIAPPADARIA